MSSIDDKKQIVDDNEKTLTQSELEQNQTASEIEQDKNIKQMSVVVHSPFKSYFDGQAFSISAENLVGPFDVLPGHHNFMTLLTSCELVIRSKTGDQRINISGGIMHVKTDRIVVFLDV